MLSTVLLTLINTVCQSIPACVVSINLIQTPASVIWKRKWSVVASTTSPFSKNQYNQARWVHAPMSCSVLWGQLHTLLLSLSVWKQSKRARWSRSPLTAGLLAANRPRLRAEMETAEKMMMRQGTNSIIKQRVRGRFNLSEEFSETLAWQQRARARVWFCHGVPSFSKSHLHRWWAGQARQLEQAWSLQERTYGIGAHRLCSAPS